MSSDFSPDVPSPARMYDYFLNGTSSFPVDRAAGDEVMRKVGRDLTHKVVWENRHFLGRVVRHLVSECGIRQFIDVGAGLPSSGNTHEVAQRVSPGTRVVYVDNDPVVATHGRALLTGSGPENTRIVTADLREPATVLDHPDTTALIDFSQPVAILFMAVLHFVRDEENPGRIVRAFGEQMAAGSYLALSHVTSDAASSEERASMEDSYDRAAAPMIFRDRAGILRLFDGFELVPPGLVAPGRWRPDRDGAELSHRLYGGVGLKS